MANGIIVTDPESFRLVFRPPVVAELKRRVEFVGDAHYSRETLARSRGVLSEVDFLFSSWRGPVLNGEFLRAAPRLRAVFHAAGSVREMVTPEFWASGIPITSAREANGAPVADFAYAQILLALKGYWRLARDYRARQIIPAERKAGPGVCDATVGLISLGKIARRLVRHLRGHRLTILAYDPFVSTEDAASLGVNLVSLPTLFAESDVVSCHAPLNLTTHRLIGRELLRLLRPGATFLNTARGAIVQREALLEVLRARPDVTALLDVTDPEPLPQHAPEFALPNLIVSPHIAGSVGNECGLLGEAMIAEFDRYIAAVPLLGGLDPEEVALST